MMDFVRVYWVQLVFVGTVLIGFFKYARAMIEATKCSLRNDMLSIYDRCKDRRQITKYQLQSFDFSYEQYKRLKGNSFIDDINVIVGKFEIVD